MPAYTLKLAVVGGVEVGKTRFCNSITNNVSKSSYEATAGCRIIEYDTNINGVSLDNQHSEQFQVTLEFWDISGDLQYKTCWTAMKKDCIGVIILFDSSKMEESHIRMWYNGFVHKAIRSKQCLILSMNNETPQFTQDPKLKKIKCINCEYANNKLSSETTQQILQWIGVVFGFHPDAEFGVFSD